MLLDRLHRARRRLALAVLVASLAWAAASAALVASTGEALQWLAPALDVARHVPSLVVAAALVTFLAMAWRHRAIRSIEAIALWTEERHPELEYALVTAVDRRTASSGWSTELDAIASAAPIEAEVKRAVWPPLVRGMFALLVAVALWIALRHTNAARIADGAGTPAPPANAPSRLTPLTGRLDPPAYARLPAVDYREPASVEGLVGSTLTLSGRGGASGITVMAGGDTTPAAEAQGGWSSRLRMPGAPGVVTLRDRSFRRLVVLVPRLDSAPAVTLTMPARDTTYRTAPSEPIAIEARATDDLGLTTGYIEYLISTGSGEHFTTATRTGTRMALGLARTAPLRAALRLDTLELTPGSVVNIRAVALDANDVTGPGKGVSETRTIRLALPNDSASISPAPPDQIDSMLISQRLLNMRTDTLLRARHRLTRTAVADKSMTYSNVQESIRLRVVAVVALLEDDGVGGTAPTDVSQLLRTAGAEMQTARIDLATAAPDSARPHMRRALAILDQVRNANRYYLRGRTPPVLVDLERVRLKGNATAEPAVRLPRLELDDSAAVLAGRVERAARLYPVDRDAALDSLTFVRVAALAGRTDVAQALARAIERLRAGEDLASALAPIRRALSAAAQPLGGSLEWLGSGSQ
jgi:hypothetical protein